MSWRRAGFDMLMVTVNMGWRMSTGVHMMTASWLVYRSTGHSISIMRINVTPNRGFKPLFTAMAWNDSYVCEQWRRRALHELPLTFKRGFRSRIVNKIFCWRWIVLHEKLCGVATCIKIPFFYLFLFISFLATLLDSQLPIRTGMFGFLTPLSLLSDWQINSWTLGRGIDFLHTFLLFSPAVCGSAQPTPHQPHHLIINNQSPERERAERGEGSDMAKPSTYVFFFCVCICEKNVWQHLLPSAFQEKVLFSHLLIAWRIFRFFPSCLFHV